MTYKIEGQKVYRKTVDSWEQVNPELLPFSEQVRIRHLILIERMKANANTAQPQQNETSAIEDPEDTDASIGKTRSYVTPPKTNILEWKPPESQRKKMQDDPTYGERPGDWIMDNDHSSIGFTGEGQAHIAAGNAGVFLDKTTGSVAIIGDEVTISANNIVWDNAIPMRMNPTAWQPSSMVTPNSTMLKDLPPKSNFLSGMAKALNIIKTVTVIKELTDD